MRDNIIVRGTVLVPKHLLSNTECELIVRTLTLTSKYGDEIQAFQETAEHYQLPKFFFTKYLIERHRHLVISQEPKAERKNWRFNGQLRPHQATPQTGYLSTPALVELLLLRRGVFAEAPCGSGKTVTANFVAGKLGMPAIIVTPTEPVRDQWIDSLHRFLPDCRITEYSGRRKDLSGDIVVASLQLLSMYPIDRAFPLFVLDEAHLAAAKEFQKAMFHVNFRFSLALTATGNRSDGLEMLFRWPLAATKVTLDTDQMPVTVITKPIEHTTQFKLATKKLESMKLDPELAMINHRNVTLMRWIHTAYKNNRRILVISKSIMQLRILREVFTKLEPGAKSAIFTGEISRYGKVVQDLKRSAADRQADEYYLKDPEAVVFSTIGKAGIGYDDVNKDCLVLALPLLDPRQVFGRVQRAAPGKKMPIVLLPVDQLYQIENRVVAACRDFIYPLGKKCQIFNECVRLLERLDGENVRHKPGLRAPKVQFARRVVQGNAKR